MARIYRMTWVPSRRGWMKEYKGKKYAISCRQLGVPETKDGSYQAANVWWESRKAEIDEASRPKLRPLLPMEDLAAALLGTQGPLDEYDTQTLQVVDLGLKADNGEETEVYIEIAKDGKATVWPTSLGRHPKPEDKITAVVDAISARVIGQLLKGKSLPEHTINCLPPARVQQVQDSVSGLRGKARAPDERTVETQSEAWLTAQQARVEAGQMTAARCANNRTCLEQFKAFLGSQADVGGIDPAKLEGFYQYCLTKIASGRKQIEGGWSVPYARDVFSVAKAFVRWLVERGTIEPPRNLASKSFKFGSPAKAVQTWTPAEFQAAVEAAPGKLKLALLLMANTGATQEDVSELKDTEVDWHAGRIIRKRSKTAGCENVPVVNYRLWPLTFELLKKYRSGGERVLLTEQGEPYVRSRLREDGKLSKADGFASNYVHLKRKLKKTLPEFNRPLKQLRKLGATLLGNHPEYGRFQSYFLGHSPRTVADRSYVVPSQEMFDKAVHWLGQQLGQVPVEDKPAETARQPKETKKEK